MGHYVRLGVLLFRTMGLIALLYSAPMLLWGLLRAGTTRAADGTTAGSYLVAWVVYAIAGLLLFALARPLAHVTARGLDGPTIDSAAA